MNKIRVIEFNFYNTGSFHIAEILGSKLGKMEMCINLVLNKNIKHVCYTQA